MEGDLNHPPDRPGSLLSSPLKIEETETNGSKTRKLVYHRVFLSAGRPGG